MSHILLFMLGMMWPAFMAAPDKHATEALAATALYRDLNRERTFYGLPTLTLDVRLDDAAITHVVDMVTNRYFSHEASTGQTPFDRMRDAGCQYRYAGENIAMAPDERLADWALFESVPHRENILNRNYTRVGIATALDAQGNLFFVEDFSD